MSLTEPAGGAAPARPASYWALSRSHTYSLIFVLPLLLLYEVAVGLMNRGAELPTRNTADWVVRALLEPLGVRGPAAVTLALIAGALVIIARERRGPEPPALRPTTFGLMLLESALLALAFGSAVSQLTATVLSPLALSAGAQIDRLPLTQRLVLSLGAGVYEELVFRVLLVSGIAGLVTVAARLAGRRERSGLTIAIAVVGSAFVFSLVHYLGSLGDAFGVWSFTFRFVGGLAFSLIYALRGYGIAAWTHALYDVFLAL